MRWNWRNSLSIIYFRIMDTYIFLTDEGYTVAPNNEVLESLQVLGFESGNTKEEALARLYQNNDWIARNGFTEHRIRCYVVSGLE